MTIFGREPAFWIGLIVTLILGVVTTLAGNGLISDVVAGKAIDLTNAIAQLATLLAPLVAALIIRQGVTPVAAPKLDQGTVVTVAAPGEGADRRIVL